MKFAKFLLLVGFSFLSLGINMATVRAEGSGYGYNSDCPAGRSLPDGTISCGEGTPQPSPTASSEQEPREWCDDKLDACVNEARKDPEITGRIGKIVQCDLEALGCYAKPVIEIIPLFKK